MVFEVVDKPAIAKLTLDGLQQPDAVDGLAAIGLHDLIHPI